VPDTIGSEAYWGAITMLPGQSCPQDGSAAMLAGFLLDGSSN
jgi:hypothetical protein